LYTENGYKLRFLFTAKNAKEKHFLSGLRG